MVFDEPSRMGTRRPSVITTMTSKGIPGAPSQFVELPRSLAGRTSRLPE
jgi:hypothetical protein